MACANLICAGGMGHISRAGSLSRARVSQTNNADVHFLCVVGSTLALAASAVRICDLDAVGLHRAGVPQYSHTVVGHRLIQAIACADIACAIGIC